MTDRLLAYLKLAALWLCWFVVCWAIFIVAAAIGDVFASSPWVGGSDDFSRGFGSGIGGAAVWAFGRSRALRPWGAE